MAKVVKVPEGFNLRVSDAHRVGHIIECPDAPPPVELLHAGRVGLVFSHASKRFPRDHAAMSAALDVFRETTDAAGRPLWGRSPFSGCTTVLKGDALEAFSITECGDECLRAYYNKPDMTVEEMREVQRACVRDALARSRANLRRAYGGENGMVIYSEMVGNVLRYNPRTGAPEFLSGVFDVFGYQDHGACNPNVRLPKPWLTAFLPGPNGTFTRMVYDDVHDVCCPVVQAGGGGGKVRLSAQAADTGLATVLPPGSTLDPRASLGLAPHALKDMMPMTSVSGGTATEADHGPGDVFTVYKMALAESRRTLFERLNPAPNEDVTVSFVCHATSADGGQRGENARVGTNLNGRC